jgi:hypothetical protein
MGHPDYEGCVANGRCGPPARVYTIDDIDFLVGYVVPEDIWYVIPVEALPQRGSGGAVRGVPQGRACYFALNQITSIYQRLSE